MKLLNDEFGNDDNYFSIINNSPLLSGSQEQTFNTSFNSDNSKTNNSPIIFEKAQNNNTKPVINIDDIKINKINDNNIDMNHPQGQMNHSQGQMNHSQGQINHSQGQINNSHGQMNHSQGQMNHSNELAFKQLQNQLINERIMDNGQMNNIQMNNNNVDNQMENNLYTLDKNIKESSFKKWCTYINYILIILLAIALNDLGKFYINRAIKYQNGSHKYYLYYVGSIIIILYLVNRMINKLD